MSNYINNFRNYNWEDHLPQVSTRPSKTVPGQDMPIKELVDRYVRGQNVETFTPTYTDEIDPQYFKMDKQDAAMAARTLAQTIELERQRVQAQKQSVAGKQIDFEQAIEEAKKEKEKEKETKEEVPK